MNNLSPKNYQDPKGWDKECHWCGSFDHASEECPELIQQPDSTNLIIQQPELTEGCMKELTITKGSATVEVIIDLDKGTATIQPHYKKIDNNGGKFRFSGNNFDLWEDVSGAITEAINIIRKELQLEVTQ